MSEETSKSLTLNKVVIALFLFMGMGFLINAALNYSQITTTQTTLDQRAIIGNESLQLNKDQTVQLNLLLEKVSNLETKLENLEKAGKTIK